MPDRSLSITNNEVNKATKSKYTNKLSRYIQRPRRAHLSLINVTVNLCDSNDSL